MTEILTMDEIRARFEGEWVLLEDPRTNDVLEVQSGKVLHHSKDRDEVWQQAIARKPGRFTVFYNGTIPEDTHYLL